MTSSKKIPAILQLVTKFNNKVQHFSAYRAPSHAISLGPSLWEASTNGTMIPVFDKFLKTLHSQSVGLPACMSLELLKDTSLSGLPLWSNAPSHGVRIHNPASLLSPPCPTSSLHGLLC